MSEQQKKEVGNSDASGVKKVYQTIEKGTVTGYKTIENGVVDGFNKITDKFVGAFLTREDETVEQAKERLAAEQKARERGK